MIETQIKQLQIKVYTVYTGNLYEGYLDNITDVSNPNSAWILWNNAFELQKGGSYSYTPYDAWREALIILKCEKAKYKRLLKKNKFLEKNITLHYNPFIGKNKEWEKKLETIRENISFTKERIKECKQNENNI